LALLLFGSWLPLHAEQLIMARAERPFPETMALLQQVVSDYGYTVARVQRVDVGLTSSGYQTAEYRIAFIGKPDEIARLMARLPELAPYLPLKIVLFAEGDSTLALTQNPATLRDLFPGDPELATQAARWERDLRAILDEVAGKL
jgi:uncharacterized protein (DUF302 family)